MTKHAIILGAGPGLGAAIPRRFAREGFRFTLIARNPEKLGHLAAGLRTEGIDVRTQIADAGDAEGLAAAMERAQEDAGAASLLVFNAVGMARMWQGVARHTAQALVDDHRVSVAALVTAVKAVLPGMQARGEGSILVTSASPTNYLPTPLSPLRITKVALNELVDVLHDELKPQGIQVTAMKVLGPIREGDYFDPARVAECYAQAWARPALAWKAHEELTIRVVELANGEGVVLPPDAPLKIVKE